MACNCEGNTYQIGMGCCQPVVANPNSYYTKSEIDEKLSGITTDDISEDEAAELIDEALLDYYTKDEVDAGFDTINLELDNKVDASAYTPTDLSNYYTKSQTDTYVSNAVSTKQDTLVSGTNIKTINGQSLLGNGNIVIQGGSSDLSNYYTRAEVDDKLDLKANASDLSALNADVEGLSISLENKADKSDIPSLADYYSKSAVDALIATLQSQIDALETQLEECCSGDGGDTGSTEGIKYVMHHNGNEYTMACNSSSTLSMDDLSFGSGTALSRTGTTDVTIGDCVTNIGAMAMQYYSAMTSCTISSSVTTIEFSAFDGCKALTSLTIPDGVTIIPLYMCRDCWNLSATNIPDGVTSIDEGAYLDCLSLMNITIPSTVTVIGNNAFRTSSWTSSDPTNYQKMQNIATGRTVTILAETPPTLGEGVFGIQTGSSDIATYPIYVPAESVEAYKAASGWSTYADRIQAIN